MTSNFDPNSFQKTYGKIKCFFYTNILCYSNPASDYLFKANNRNTRKRCDICSKLTIKTPK